MIGRSNTLGRTNVLNNLVSQIDNPDPKNDQQLVTRRRVVSQIQNISPLSGVWNYFKNKKPQSYNLAEIIDISKDEEHLHNMDLRLIPFQPIYDNRITSGKASIYKYTGETTCRVTTKSLLLPFVEDKGIAALENRNLPMIHSGLILIGIKGLTRKGTGAKTFITLLDTRWDDAKLAVISGMEIDMNDNIGLAYCIPNYSLTVKDFIKHFRIGIQTKGYEKLKEGTNLLIRLGFIGKLMTNHEPRFNIQIERLVASLGSKGVKMLQPIAEDSNNLAGLEWQLSQFIPKSIDLLEPTNALYYKNLKGDYSVRFNDYKPSTSQDLDPSDD